MNASRNYNEQKRFCDLCGRVSILFSCLNTRFAEAAETGRQIADPLSASALGQVITGLLLVIVIIFVITWVIRRVPGLQNMGQGTIRIIDSLPLSQRERILLVQINRQQLLLGVTSQHISTLHVLDEPVEKTTSQKEMANRLVKAFSNRRGQAS
ncbi:MAG: flagellar biosynthetic protein FliO [Gammaproteobacteria bacterium]|nr:flagellar biosynthetic protein FliO [Gammaproteobacteria bacterium]